jgi:hypothetical protein
LLLSLRDEIVEIRSPETGTPLPDRYRLAPSELMAAKEPE